MTLYNSFTELYTNPHIISLMGSNNMPVPTQDELDELYPDLKDPDSIVYKIAHAHLPNSTADGKPVSFEKIMKYLDDPQVLHQDEINDAIDTLVNPQ